MVAIAAVDENWGIGKDGDQLCYLRADLKRFQLLTTGHPVILGRKTLATFPSGRPLPRRRNLILSRDPGFSVEGAEVFRSVEELLAQAPEDSFVIGGESVYRALLGACDRVYLTQIQASFPADTWFPDLDADPAWQVREREVPLEEGGISFHYVTYERVGACI